MRFALVGLLVAAVLFLASGGHLVFLLLFFVLRSAAWSVTGAELASARDARAGAAPSRSEIPDKFASGSRTTRSAARYLPAPGSLCSRLFFASARTSVIGHEPDYGHAADWRGSLAWESGSERSTAGLATNEAGHGAASPRQVGGAEKRSSVAHVAAPSRSTTWLTRGGDRRA